MDKNLQIDGWIVGYLGLGFNPLVLYVWGYLQSLVHVQTVDTRDELINKMMNAAESF